MHCSVVTIALQLLASLLIINGALSTVDHKQNGCYEHNALLECPLYQEPKQGAPSLNLKWRYRDNSTGIWERLASVRRGKQRIFPVNTNLHGRFTVHSNGSLEIRSLHPADETLYMCIVMQGGDREAHLIELNLNCGNVTVVKREVCVEEDVFLDCEAKHRIVPWKLEQITWLKKKNSEHGTASYSKVAALKDSTAEAYDGFGIHGNGSLLVHKGRSEGNHTYKCDVSKIEGGRVRPHFVELRSVKCQEEKPKPETIVRPTLAKIASAYATQNTSVLSDPIGTFQSPSFPNAYPENFGFQWDISVPQAYSAINITLDHLNLEPEKKCRYDYVVVYDRLGNQVGCRHCGYNVRPIQFQVRGRQAVVVFKSDGSVEKTGFKASYKGV